MLQESDNDLEGRSRERGGGGRREEGGGRREAAKRILSPEATTPSMRNWRWMEGATHVVSPVKGLSLYHGLPFTMLPTNPDMFRKYSSCQCQRHSH